MYLTTNLVMNIIVSICLLIDTGLHTVLNKVEPSTITIFCGRFFGCGSPTDTFLFHEVGGSSGHLLNDLAPYSNLSM